MNKENLFTVLEDQKAALSTGGVGFLNYIRLPYAQADAKANATASAPGVVVGPLVYQGNGFSYSETTTGASTGFASSGSISQSVSTF